MIGKFKLKSKLVAKENLESRSGAVPGTLIMFAPIPYSLAVSYLREYSAQGRLLLSKGLGCITF